MAVMSGWLLLSIASKNATSSSVESSGLVKEVSTPTSQKSTLSSPSVDTSVNIISPNVNTSVKIKP